MNLTRITGGTTSLTFSLSVHGPSPPSLFLGKELLFPPFSLPLSPHPLPPLPLPHAPPPLSARRGGGNRHHSCECVTHMCITNLVVNTSASQTFPNPSWQCAERLPFHTWSPKKSPVFSPTCRLSFQRCQNVHRTPKKLPSSRLLRWWGRKRQANSWNTCSLCSTQAATRVVRRHQCRRWKKYDAINVLKIPESFIVYLYGLFIPACASISSYKKSPSSVFFKMLCIPVSMATSNVSRGSKLGLFLSSECFNGIRS